MTKDITSTCEVEGCDLARFNSKIFCCKHYRRFQRYGDPEYTKVASNTGKLCSADNCEKPAKSSGMCQTHYMRVYRGKGVNQTNRHGKRDHPLYSTWKGMKQRCIDKKADNYHNYGGKGIKVCKEWVNDFDQFFKDVGEKPSDDYTLDRIDSDGDYCKENCRWATVETQNRNKGRREKGRIIDSGVKGVHWYQPYRKWCANIRVDKKQKTLGYYDTIAEAAEARQKAELKYWGNNGKRSNGAI